MSYKSIVVSVLLVAFLAGASLFLMNRNNTEEEDVPEIISPDNSSDSAPQSFTFSNPKKSAHYESNTPEHAAILAAAPINIVINFNFDLASPSSISITKDGQEYTTGDLIIDSNKLTMRKAFDVNAPDGIYKVIYNACWPDRTCHDGSFEFAINRETASTYEDMTSVQEVEIKMSDIMFKPKNIKISRGTRVTWVNDESIAHYVNTDSHPAHTYHKQQNSSALNLGDKYSTVFSSPGIYPYHCSAHADVMTGNIIVI